MLNITHSETLLLIKYIDIVSGISLDENKAYLLESRLYPLLKEVGCENYNELYLKAKEDRSKNISRKIINAISTNETSFFRDNDTFELLKYKIIPDLIDSINKNRLPQTIKIWSAACSTGQEVYSIGMCIKEVLPDWSDWSISILGTDISSDAILKARMGTYNNLEVGRGLANDRLVRYCNHKENSWSINDDLRSIVHFQQINLLESFALLGVFDVIFCRNVAIYFSPENRKLLFDALSNRLAHNGALLLGSTEFLGSDNNYARLEYHNSVMFKKV